ncbi:hypothetical protein KR059_005340, partial [Drosophila kikkawai]
QQFLRLLVLFGLLLACQARTLDQEKVPVEEKVSNQEIASPPQALQPVEVKEEVSKGNQEPKPQLSNSINNQVIEEAQPSQANSKPVEAQVQPEVKSEEKEPIANEITKEEEQESPKEEIPKEEAPKSNVVPLKPSEVQGRDNGNVQYVYDANGQLLGVQDLEKIFKYQGVQVFNGSQFSGQYQNYYGNPFNKFQSYPKVEYVPDTVTVVNTTGANVTHHIHNHTHYYSNHKKPGFPLPFLPNPFEKNEPTYVHINSTSGNVTQTQYTDSKPFPFLPNPFTDFPKVVGLSLVLLPNPFYVNKSQSSVGSSSGNVQYQYFDKFRSFSDEPQQKQQQQQKPNFYLVPNPLGNQVPTDGQKAGDANVLLPVNLAALPLLVPTSEVSQGKGSSVSSSGGSIKLEDLIKATNVHVSQPLKFQASNGASQFQRLFQKQSLVPDERRSQSAAEPAGVQAEEESSVLFAVEIPKPIYRFFKGIFGGFSN